MSQTLSLASPSIAPGWSTEAAFPYGAGAVSDEGRYVAGKADEFDRHLRSSVTFGTVRYNAIGELRDTFREHCRAGWDGQQAPALSPYAVSCALAILNHLPRELADPEFSVEPDDGSLVLEWWGGYRQLVSVAISATRRHSFIAIDGINEFHGVFSTVEGRLPDHLVQVIRGTAGRRRPQSV